MTRVSTYANFQSALLDLMKAQTRGLDAQKRLATQKVAEDLEGFGRNSETLTALKSAESRLKGFLDTSETVAARLKTQDLALVRVADAADAARQAIAEALASGRVDGLMLDLQSEFLAAQDGLNAKHQGRYLFSGASIDTAPVTADTLGDLSAAASAADVFVNDDLKSVSRLDESTSVETGFLARDLGEGLFNAFRDVQLFHEGANGPLNGEMTDAQRAFLTDQLAAFDAAHLSLTAQAARNGSMQNRVDTMIKSHEAQQIALQGLLGERTDADMARAVTDLELSQIAIQASAQVLSRLREVSLLNLLAP